MWSPGLDSQASAGQAAVNQVGPVLDLLQLALDDADQAVQVGGGEVGHGPIEQRPDTLGRIKIWRVRGQPVDPQPGLILLGEGRQLGRQVDVEVIPDPDQRGGQLAVGGEDQVPVISPGEALGLALAAAVGAQVARHSFISGHTWSFHTATASSSRSSACRTGTWQDQPWRRISFHTPSGVYPMWNSRPISVLIRPSVQRWSLANPCASGPLPSSASSSAHCCGLSFSRDTGPFDRSASAPPSRQARCHRRTDPSVTLRSCAISVIPSPRANRSAACSRSRSRRCCSAGVYPPRCAYRMLSSYARSHPTSRPALYELILVSPIRWT